MAFRRLTKKLLQRIDSGVRVCARRGTHRPTVAVVLEHLVTRKFLIVAGKTDSDGSYNPGIVKGGIQKKERVLVAAAREISEEVGIKKSQLSFRKYGGAYSVASVKKKEGFSKKLYYVFYAQYDGPEGVTHNAEELSGCCWVPPEDIETHLSCLKEVRPEKYEVLLKIFSDLRRKKQKPCL